MNVAASTEAAGVEMGGAGLKEPQDASQGEQSWGWGVSGKALGCLRECERHEAHL